MREIVKVVKGYEITKLKGCNGFYRVYIAPGKFLTFKTIKAAIFYCETL